MKQTDFTKLLQDEKYDDARYLLEQELASGRLLDPRKDTYWTGFADALAHQMGRKSEGADILFWSSFLDFFIKIIEPAWGHAHKGHIYFRRGLAIIPKDLGKGKTDLESAYQEDLTLEMAKGGAQDEISERARQYSAYVALTILERIEDADFPNQNDKKRFIAQLFESFDAAIFGIKVRPGLVETAINAIVPANALSACLGLHRELQDASARKLPFATVTLTGAVLEALILSDLYHRKGIKVLSNGKDILKVELGPLFEEAIKKSVFPVDSVRVAFQLVHIFRNRLHPGNELRQKYKLTQRVATTVKICFELAVVQWSGTQGPGGAV